MIRVHTKIGDVFFAKLTEGTKKYFQFIAKDPNQLYCDVIRVFKKDYDLKDEPDLNQVISEVVEFYAHCVVRVGVKLGYWEKAGRVENKGEFHKVIFRCKMDYGLGNANFKGLSHHWEVWNLEDYIVKKMDKLEKKYYAADIGPIIPPKDIVYRMKTGEYDFIYPSYED